MSYNYHPFNYQKINYQQQHQRRQSIIPMSFNFCHHQHYQHQIKTIFILFLYIGCSLALPSSSSSSSSSSLQNIDQQLPSSSSSSSSISSFHNNNHNNHGQAQQQSILSKPLTSSFISSPLSLEKRASQRMQYNFGLGKRIPSYRSDSDEILELVPSSSSSNFFENPSMNGRRSKIDLRPYYYQISNAIDDSDSTNINDDNNDNFDEFHSNIPAFAPSLQKSNIPMTLFSFLDQNDKRSRPQRFSFGLGKRSKEQAMFNGLNNNNLEENNNKNNNLDDDFDMNSMEKRKIQPYGFGLGKRQQQQQQQINSKKIKKLTNFEDFIKRRYSFGLGKRSV
ncbi:uncharacterized protein LOC113788782 isoform X2 [Dermatophagoides pteronyssinus]|uniref:uncharacterized protein LOC113788782 isoform X2 n=1 Tax=Dermatophagoides pteronyssinus TaxID=6956 RepID=UPI003F675A24